MERLRDRQTENIMQNTSNNLYPIRTVSSLTGVNAITLRAWERRYDLIKPIRTAKGHRLYTRADIRLIQEILQRLSQGMSISQITREVLDSGAVDETDDADGWGRYSRRGRYWRRM